MRVEILAFPGPPSMDREIDNVYPAQRAMKLRDYFVATMLQGVLVARDCRRQGVGEVAIHAFKFADAMINARRTYRQDA